MKLTKLRENDSVGSVQGADVTNGVMQHDLNNARSDWLVLSITLLADNMCVYI